MVLKQLQNVCAYDPALSGVIFWSDKSSAGGLVAWDNIFKPLLSPNPMQNVFLVGVNKWPSYFMDFHKLPIILQKQAYKY